MRCEYCHNLDHTIDQCPSEDIVEIADELRAWFRNMNMSTNKPLFIITVRQDYSRIMLQAVAYYFGIRSPSRNENRCIEQLWEYFYLTNTFASPGFDGEEATSFVPELVPVLSVAFASEPVAYTMDITHLTGKMDAAKATALANLKMECAICLKDDISYSDIVTLNCKHEFCGSCLKTMLQMQRNCCALCREPISSVVVRCAKHIL